MSVKTINRELIGQEFVRTNRATCLAEGEIHLWQWHCSDPLAPREFACLAREQLIYLLQHYAASDEVPTIERGTHGKPFVADPRYPHFNMSHSGQWVALAFSRDHELGVDIEKGASRRRFGSLELAERFFTKAEFSALAALDESSQDAAFMQLWTCKEAVLKAIGHGLSFGLDRLQFALDTDASASTLEMIAAEAGVPQDWQIHRFMSAYDLVGSLAWRGPPRHIKTWLLDPLADA